MRNPRQAAGCQPHPHATALWRAAGSAGGVSEQRELPPAADELQGGSAAPGSGVVRHGASLRGRRSIDLSNGLHTISRSHLESRLGCGHGRSEPRRGLSRRPGGATRGVAAAGYRLLATALTYGRGLRTLAGTVAAFFRHLSEEYPS